MKNLIIPFFWVRVGGMYIPFFPPRHHFKAHLKTGKGISGKLTISLLSAVGKDEFFMWQQQFTVSATLTVLQEDGSSIWYTGTRQYCNNTTTARTIGQLLTFSSRKISHCSKPTPIVIVHSVISAASLFSKVAAFVIRLQTSTTNQKYFIWHQNWSHYWSIEMYFKTRRCTIKSGSSGGKRRWQLSLGGRFTFLAITAPLLRLEKKKWRKPF